MNRFLTLMFIASCVASAQDQPVAPPATTEDAKPVLNIFIDRVGFGKDVNYGYAEWFQIRGTKHPKWSVILPDVGMIFFDDIQGYRELFVGAGLEVQVTKALTLDHEAYYDQATGPAAHGKAYYQPWTRVGYDFPHHVISETVAFPYIPLNGGHTQFVLERAKLEYTGFNRFNFGGGIGMFQEFGLTDLQDKPFVTVTVKTKQYGNFEFWIQAMPGDTFQIQYRHAIAWHSRR
jgi:hypothetical protein